VKQLNAIFKYRTRLIEQTNAGLISASSARGRINAVVNFYRFLVTEDLVDHQSYGMPFQDVYKYIAVDNDLVHVEKWQLSHMILRFMFQPKPKF
jgi:hypothetical protein